MFRLVYNLQIIEYLIDPVSADDDNNFREILSSREAFSANPTPVNSPIRRKKNSTDDLDNSKLELTRSLSIEEIDLKETLVTAKSWKSEFLQRGGFSSIYLRYFLIDQEQH